MARSTHEAMLASWSTAEMTISSPASKLSAYERLRYSCVVDEPRTISSSDALIYFAAASYPSSYRAVDFLPVAYVAPSWTLVLRR
jgi:hypothetical protein